MGSREYQGAGGLRLHLDEPLSDEMAKQVARGHLVPVVEASSADEPVVEKPTEDPDDETQKKPNANSKVDEWRTYAVSLGMDEDEAGDATKKDLQEWVQVHEDGHADGGSGD